MGILLQPFVPHLAESKLAFHHAEGVFHSGADSGLSTVIVTLIVRQFPLAATFLLSQLHCAGCSFADSAAFAAVAESPRSA